MTISVSELLGVPKVTCQGQMDSWHTQSFAAVMDQCKDNGNTKVVLDIACLDFLSTDSAMAMVTTLRKVGPEMSVHIVANSSSRQVLESAGLGPYIKHYSSSDEIAEQMAVEDVYYTSRWLAAYEEMQQEELPKAA